MIPVAPRHPLVMLALGLILLPWPVLGGRLHLGHRHRDRDLRHGRARLQSAARLHRPALLRPRLVLRPGRILHRAHADPLVPQQHAAAFRLRRACSPRCWAWWSAFSRCAGAACISRCSRSPSPRSPSTSCFAGPPSPAARTACPACARWPLLGLDLDDQRVFYYFCAAIVFAHGVAGVARGALAAGLGAGGDTRERAARALRRLSGAALQARRLHRLRPSVTGLGGCLFAYLKLFVSADLVHPSFSGEILAMTIFGGMGSFLGPALGAVFYLMFRESRVQLYREPGSSGSGCCSWPSSCSRRSVWSGLGERVLAPLRRKRASAAAMAARVTPQPRPGGARLPARASQARTGRWCVCSRRDQAVRRLHRSGRRRHRLRGSQAARADRPQRRRQDHPVQPDLGHVRAGSGHGRAGRPGRSAACRRRRSRRMAWRARSRSPACFPRSACGSICASACRRARPALQSAASTPPRSSR